MVDDHETALVASGESEGVLLKGALEAGAVVGESPRLLNDLFQVAGVFPQPFRLLPCVDVVIEGVAAVPLLDARGSLHPHGGIHGAAHVPKLFLGMGKLRRPVPLGVDAGPDGMSVPPPFLLVKNQGARLAFQVWKLRLDQIRRRLEVVDAGVMSLRRIEADGKKRLAAMRGLRRRLDLKECPEKVAGGEAGQLVQFDMIVVAVVHQVEG